LILLIVCFPLGIRLAEVLLPRVPRTAVLAMASLVGLLVMTYSAFRSPLVEVWITLRLAGVCWIIYIAFAVLHWNLLCAWARHRDWRTQVPFLFPILLLVIAKYVPLPNSFPLKTGLHGGFGSGLFVGISYMAFRLSYLTLEVRNNTVTTPGIMEYLAFAFFLPTLSVGPINSYETHSSRTSPQAMSWCALRIIIGAVKFLFLAALINQLSYAGLLLDGHPHSRIDLPIAVISYYIFLYLNFSGYCDIAIGVAGLVGIRVAENFDNPFVARNVKDFWNRWHITLSVFMRDVVFSPLSKWLVRLMGPALSNHAIAICIMVVFLIVGVWHGVGWNYFLFGLAHGVAVVANHYYAIYLKRLLGRDRFLAYGRSSIVRAGAVVITFLYVSATMFLFANSITSMRKIFTEIR